MSDYRYELADEDAERLARILLLVDPTPPEVYEQARARFRWALELRSGGVPVASRPGQHPGEVAVPENAASPGHQTPGARDGAAGPWASARPASKRRFFALARKAVRALAWLVASLLLVVAAIGAGFFFGILALLYGGPF